MALRDDRYPFPEFPSGWFFAALTRDLPRGRLLRRTWLGEEVVLFRGSSGAAVALAAHCPHLGAHMGYGGTVVGDTLRCPFHGFCFGRSGACVSAPYGAKLPAARARTWPLIERNGFIFLHNGPPEPAWEIPRLEMHGWSSLLTRSYRLRTHPQETAENSVDFAHLQFLHGYDGVRQVGEMVADGPVMRVDFAFQRSAGVFVQPGKRVHVNAHVEVHGLGYSVVEVAVPEKGLQSRHWVFPVPLRDGVIALQTALSVKRVVEPARVSRALALAPRGLATELVRRAIFTGFTRDLRQDFAIWENKVYVDPPALILGDGPIAKYRRWCRQFYPPAEAHVPAGIRPGG